MKTFQILVCGNIKDAGASNEELAKNIDDTIVGLRAAGGKLVAALSGVGVSLAQLTVEPAPGHHSGGREVFTLETPAVAVVAVPAGEPERTEAT